MPKYSRQLVFLFILYLTLSFSLVASNVEGINFRKISVDEGLSSGRINCLHQDKLGFLWVGTYNGLNRFNGYQFENFYANILDTNSINDNIVLCIEETKDSSIWIGTRKGLCVYNLKNDEFSRIYDNPLNKDVSNNDRINDLSFDKKGLLWCATNSGLKQFDIKLKTYVNSYELPINSNNTKGDRIKCLCLVGELLWVGSDSGLFLFDVTKKQFIQQQLLDVVPSISAIHKDSMDNLWVGTLNRGLYKLTGGITKEVANFSIQSGHIQHNRIGGIASTNNHTLYITTSIGGLYIFDSETEVFINFQPDIYDDKSLDTRCLTGVLTSKENHVWIGTLKHGLNFIDANEKKFTHYKRNFKTGGLINNNIRSLFEDSEGSIWVGTKEGGGLSKFNKADGSFTHYLVEKNKQGVLNNGYVSAIAEANETQLLVGTLGGGLSVFDKATSIFTSYPISHNQSLATRCINDIHVDGKGVIWLATQASLYIFSLEDGTYKRISGFKSVTTICEGSNGVLWLGTAASGLFSYNTVSGETKRYTHNPYDDKSIASNKIIDITLDMNDVLWLATGNGISSFNKDQDNFITYNISDGLPSNGICKILVDLNNDLWISTENGISKFLQDNNTFRNFDKADGLQGNIFEETVGCTTMDGEILFGGSNGFNIFFSDEIKDNPITPKLVFTDLSIFNKSVKVNDNTEILSQHISLTNKIALHHTHESFTIEYAALNYSSSEKNQYQYKLVGMDKDWVNAGNIRWANYTNLKPGSYIFKVRGSNNDGVWNNDGISLQITVTPPMWETWWFKFLMISIVLIVFVLIYTRRVKALKQQKIVLEDAVQSRTAELQIAYENLKQNNLEIENKNLSLKNKKNKLTQQKKKILEQKHTLSIQNNELIIQHEELERLHKELQSANQMKLEFFTNVSHEFRTPLTLLLVPINKLLKLKGVVDINKYHSLIVMMEANGNRLLHLINRLIDFRRIEKGKTDIKLELVDITSFVNNIQNAFYTIAIQNDIEYTFYSNVKENKQLIDVEKMEIIISNLLSNAFKFTPKNGKIDVRVISKKQYTQIEVIDSGIGIAKENLKGIFDRFVQVKNAEQFSNNGSGIGLALTQEMVRLLGGKITVNSKPNIGSEFKVILPNNGDIPTKEYNDISSEVSKKLFSSVDAEKLGLASNVIIANDTIVVDKQKPLILIVDDNQSIRTLIRLELEGIYQVIEAGDGQQGLHLAKKYNPNLIISDVKMPNMNGFEFCKEIKTHLETSHIPVILLTAYTSDKNHIKGLRLGADDYIAKPFNVDVVVATIKNRLMQRKELQERFERVIDINPKEISVTDADEHFLNGLIAILEEEISNSDLSVAMICQKLNISEGHIYRKTQSLTGMNPSNFIREFRLKRAAHLLSTTNLRVIEVQDMVGYESKSAFSVAFKKRYKLSPAQFSKSNVSKVY